MSECLPLSFPSHQFFCDRQAGRGVPLGCYMPEQGIKLLGLLLTGSTGQRMASRNGLAWHTLASKGFRVGWWQPLFELGQEIEYAVGA